MGNKHLGLELDKSVIRLPLPPPKTTAWKCVEPGVVLKFFWILMKVFNVFVMIFALSPDLKGTDAMNIVIVANSNHELP